MDTSINRDKKGIGHVKGGGRTFCSAAIVPTANILTRN